MIIDTYRTDFLCRHVHVHGENDIDRFRSKNISFFLIFQIDRYMDIDTYQCKWLFLSIDIWIEVQRQTGGYSGRQTNI